MIYSVLLDGVGIYESDNNVIISEPRLSIEMNAAGNFEFTMPPWHDRYSHVNPLKSFVEVFEAGESVFYGRVSPHVEIDWNNNKKVYCEGALAFFGDSVQRPYEWESVSLHEFFETLITRHNEQVDADVQFTVGNVTIPDAMLYEKTEYESTLECLETMCLGANGGFMLCRRSNGINYIDWYAEAPYTGNQPVQFGLNLMDLTQIMENSDFCTVVIPLGAEDENGIKVTVTDVNDGHDYVESEAVSTYGRITKVVNFDSVTDPIELLELAEDYLEQIQFEGLSIECTAAELHHLSHEYTQFLLGQLVHVTSTPHLLDANFPIVKMELELDKAGKQITIGTLEKQELTAIVKDGEESSKSEQTVLFDPTPTAGSNKAVTSAGIYSALGPLEFSLNQDGTVRANFRGGNG